MPPIPQRREFTTRLPPHVYGVFEELIAGCNRHLRRELTQSDMVGALVLRARRERRGLLDDVAAYLDVWDTWREDGSETLPEL
jgi:hypothetical protein